MNLTYREDKAAEVAALFLKMAGGKMSKIKLIKLLYIVERESLIKRRRPVIFDRYVSMDRGPVMSKTLNIINGDQRETSGPWDEAISPPDTGHIVGIKNPPGKDNLSDAEVKLIEEVFKRYDKTNPWKLCDETHFFPEWKDPDGSSIPITYKDILSGAGKTPDEIASILDELNNIAQMDKAMEQ